jgi:hypothetical protein
MISSKVEFNRINNAIHYIPESYAFFVFFLELVLALDRRFGAVGFFFFASEINSLVSSPEDESANKSSSSEDMMIMNGKPLLDI